MMFRRGMTTVLAVGALGAAAAAAEGQASPDSPTKGQFQFTPLATSTPCTSGGTGEQPFVLPTGYQQAVLAREGMAARSTCGT